MAAVSGIASDRGWLCHSSSPVPLKTRRVGQRCTLNLELPPVGVVCLGEGVPAQVSSTSLDHGSKLRGPSPKALVQLIAVNSFTHSLRWDYSTQVTTRKTLMLSF
ncbi:hypothetical protein TNCV_4792011 [Trichonephila clavipes]|nr:hypothetical protein TNCV_4792011 [Trichonephila clavipes]